MKINHDGYEQKLAALRERLLKGKESFLVRDFHPDAFLAEMKKKYKCEEAFIDQHMTSS